MSRQREKTATFTGVDKHLMPALEAAADELCHALDTNPIDTSSAPAPNSRHYHQGSGKGRLEPHITIR